MVGGGSGRAGHAGQTTLTATQRGPRAQPPACVRVGNARALLRGLAGHDAAVEAHAERGPHRARVPLLPPAGVAKRRVAAVWRARCSSVLDGQSPQLPQHPRPAHRGPGAQQAEGQPGERVRGGGSGGGRRQHPLRGHPRIAHRAARRPRMPAGRVAGCERAAKKGGTPERPQPGSARPLRWPGGCRARWADAGAGGRPAAMKRCAVAACAPA